MNKLITLLLLLSYQISQATSLHPCTPSVQMQPTYITCQVGNSYTASIKIDVVASPQLAMCSGKNYIEYKTAKVVVSNKQGQTIKSLDILSGDFSYQLSPTGSAAFKSEKNKIDLKSCVSPLHGGLSFGS